MVYANFRNFLWTLTVLMAKLFSIHLDDINEIHFGNFFLGNDNKLH